MAGNRREFDRSMEDIEASVIELFAMIAEDLPQATEALLSGDTDATTALAGREKLIDSLYLQIEEMAGRLILLQAPVAADLRFLLTVLRIVPELERSHDLIMDIASRAPRLRAAIVPQASRALARQMADVASLMWGQAADAWYGRDHSASTAISARATEMGDLHCRLVAEITVGGMTVPAAVDMAQAARDYERLGAHAANITRRVRYLAGGHRR